MAKAPAPTPPPATKPRWKSSSSSSAVIESGQLPLEQLLDRLPARRGTAAVLPRQAAGGGKPDQGAGRRHAQAVDAGVTGDALSAAWMRRSAAPGRLDLRSGAQRLDARRAGARRDWVVADAPAGLGEAMRYAVLDGGKRLRPLLVLAACEAVERQRGGRVARGLRRRTDPCLFAGARRHALHGQRRAAPRQAHGAREVRPGPGAAGRRRAAGAGVRTADARRRRPCRPRCRRRCAACWRARPATPAWPAARRSTWPASGVSLGEAQLREMHRRKTGALLQASVMMGAACGAADAAAQSALSRLRRGRGPGLPGGGRHAGRHRRLGHAGQDAPARTRPRTSPPTCRCWGWKARPRSRRNCWTRRCGPWLRAACATHGLYSALAMMVVNRDN